MENSSIMHWIVERKEWFGLGSVIGLLNTLFNPTTLMAISSTIVSTIYVLAIALCSGFATALGKEVFTICRDFIIKKYKK